MELLDSYLITLIRGCCIQDIFIWCPFPTLDHITTKHFIHTSWILHILANTTAVQICFYVKYPKRNTFLLCLFGAFLFLLSFQKKNISLYFISF